MESKSKMVSFRLSPVEYSDVEEACRAHGYRSISLFARCAILAFRSEADNAKDSETQISELRERIDTMAAELIRLSALARKPVRCDCAGCAAASATSKTATAS